MTKIIIAEDDNTTRRLLVEIVESLGHSAIQCSDGQRAWLTLQDNPDVAMLITDIMMPELDGRLLTKKIRGDEHYKSLPIVLVSGVIKLHEINGILQEGVSRFLPKPIDRKFLTDYINQLVS